MQSINFSVRFEFCILLAILLLLMPLQVALSWVIAVFVHEVFHYIALRMFRVRIISLTVGFNGAVMETEQMGSRVEIICALAGPLGSLSLLLVSTLLPYVALFGLIQALFNLVPIYPLDGGRVLRCITDRYFKTYSDRICFLVEWTIIITFSIVVIFVFRGWQIAFVALIWRVIRRGVLKIPCKP